MLTWWLQRALRTAALVCEGAFHACCLLLDFRNPLVLVVLRRGQLRGVVLVLRLGHIMLAKVATLPLQHLVHLWNVIRRFPRII